MRTLLTTLCLTLTACGPAPILAQRDAGNEWERCTQNGTFACSRDRKSFVQCEAHEWVPMALEECLSRIPGYVEQGYKAEEIELLCRNPEVACQGSHNSAQPAGLGASY